MHNGDKVCRQNEDGDNVNVQKGNENCKESDTVTRKIRSSAIVADPQTTATKVNSLKRKCNTIEDVAFPTQIIPFSDQDGKDFNKVNCCCFCYALESRIYRHLKSNHNTEEEVQFILHSKSISEKAMYKKLL